MTRPDTSRGSEWHWLWEAYVVGVLGAAMIAVTLLQNRFGGHVLPAVAALAAIAAGVLLVGSRLLRREASTWQLGAFIAVTVALWVLALLASPVAVVAVPVLYPLIFAGLPLRPALVVTTAVSLIPLTLTLLVDTRSANLTLAVAITLIGVVTAPIIGTV
ncbi:MAG: sensor histidine kinase, partial [Mycobacterium sp.]